MASQQDLTLAVLFKAIEDGTFKRVIGKLNTLLSGLNTTLNKADAASKKLDKSADKLSKTLKQTGKSADSTGKQIGKVTGGINRLAAAFRVTAAYFLSTRLFYGITTGLREGVAEIVNFDQALHNLAAISGATQGELASMKDIILDTADRTKYSTTEIAEGMVLLAQAGLTAGETVSAIGAVADLAAGTLTNLATATDLVSTTLRAFNIDAGETRRVADVMANAINRSKLTVDKLRIAFNYVGVSAHQAGLSIEQTGATMMLLANAGARASTIGTGLRQVLARLLSPNKKLREAMATYSLEIDEANGKTEWFEKQVGKLAAVLYNAETGTVDMAKAYQLFGLRGAQTAAILVDSYMDVNGAWERNFQAASRLGTAQEMMEEQAKGLAFKVKNLTDKMRNLAIVMGDAGFTKVLGIAVDTLRVLTSALTWFAGTLIGKAVVNTLLLTTTIGGLVLVFKALMAVLTPLIAMLTGGILANPAVWGVVAIAAVIGSIAALISYYKNLENAAAKVVAENKAFIKSIDNYREQLQQVIYGSEEYYAIVERLKQAHPELAREIDKVKDSYQDLDEVLQRVKTEQQEEALKKLAAQFQGLSFHLQDLILDYEGYKKRTGEANITLEEWVNQLHGFSAWFSGNKTHFKAFKGIVTELADSFQELYEQGKTDEITKKLQELAKGTDDSLSEMYRFVDTSDELIKAVFDEMAKNVEFKTKALERRNKALQAQIEKMVSDLPASYRNLIKSLSLDQYLLFIDAIKNANNEWARKKKLFEDYAQYRYTTEEQKEKELSQAKLSIYKKHLDEFVKADQKRMRDILQDVPENWRKTYEQAADYQKFELAKAYEDAIDGWAEVLKWHQQNNRKQGESTKAFYERMDKLRQTFFDKELESFNRKEDAKLYKAEEVLQKINEKYSRYTGNRYDKEAAKAESFYNQMEQKIDQLVATEKEKDEIRLKNKEAYFARLRRLAQIYGFGEEYTREDFENVTGETAPEITGVGSLNELIDRWKTVGGEAKAYIEHLDTLRLEGKINLEQHRQALERTFATPGDAFKNGWKKAMEEVKTASEFLYDLGSQLPDQLADGFVDAWDSFLDGTKSAGEAFEDFARGVLKWIAQMITKWLVLKAFQGLTGTSIAHGGGIIGRDSFQKRNVPSSMFSIAPRLHDGINNNLKRDEYPAILQKDEGVFTKEQMKALGLGGRGDTSISVPVNITGGDGNDLMKKHLPAAIEEAVLKTMRRYMK